MKKNTLALLFVLVLLVLTAACAPGTTIQINTPVPGSTPAAGGGKVDVPGVSLQIDAPGPNPEMGKPDANGRVAGVIPGLWHGIISPITLILSFANPAVQIYEVHNDGTPYNLGFLLGIVLVTALISAGLARRR